MYKAEATDQVLAALDASQRSMGYATGFSYPRWQQGLDIQLLKRSGKIGAMDLRTISCTEPDPNMNNRRSGEMQCGTVSEPKLWLVTIWEDGRACEQSR